jgi:hypothetical protein
MNRLSVWERRTEGPLLAAALLFLLRYAIPILDTGIPPAVRSVCSVVLAATWVVFLLDFVGRIWLAERRSHYLIRHVTDLLVLAVPVLRPLRLLPHHRRGRFVAVGLMISGIALIGVVTASFATWLIDRVRQVEAESRAATAPMSIL